MSLVDVQLPINQMPLPRDVRQFLKVANRRVERFSREHNEPGFIPSDYPCVYRALQALMYSEMATGNLFCEWGSGLGIVCCLASMLGFDTVGIENVEELVEEAEKLAERFEVPVEYIQDSFIPPDAPVLQDDLYPWLDASAGELEERMDLSIEDFNVIYVYPWPDEEQIVADLFDHYASEGTFLLTYHSLGEVRARRKE